MTRKILFEKETGKGKYQAIKEESNSSKKITMQFIEKSRTKIIWEIELLNSNINIIRPFLGIRWPVSSAEKSKTFIEIPKQLTEIEKLDYPEYTRRFLTNSDSNTTTANLNLDGKRKDLRYFGRYFGEGRRPLTTHKKLLEILSKELGIKIKQF